MSEQFETSGIAWYVRGLTHISAQEIHKLLIDISPSYLVGCTLVSVMERTFIVSFISAMLIAGLNHPYEDRHRYSFA